MAAFILHNVIRLHEKGMSILSEDSHTILGEDFNVFDKDRCNEMKRVRDEIAQQIWSTL